MFTPFLGVDMVCGYNGMPFLWLWMLWRQKDPADVINDPNQLTLSGLKEYCFGWVWPSEMNPLNEDPQTLSY